MSYSVYSCVFLLQLHCRGWGRSTTAPSGPWSRPTSTMSWDSMRSQVPPLSCLSACVCLHSNMFRCRPMHLSCISNLHPFGLHSFNIIIHQLKQISFLIRLELKTLEIQRWHSHITNEQCWGTVVNNFIHLNSSFITKIT